MESLSQASGTTIALVVASTGLGLMAGITILLVSQIISFPRLIYPDTGGVLMLFDLLVAATAIIAVVAAGFLNDDSGKSALFQNSNNPVTLRSKGSKCCRWCGNLIYENSKFCDRCGTCQNETQSSSLDEEVYMYIVSRGGVIMLSKALRDLGLTAEQFREISARLMSHGLLSQD